MEILALRLHITEEDVNALVARHLPDDQPLQDVRARLTPEGVRISGRYPTSFFAVRFEALWQLAVHEGRLMARLAGLDVGGMPVGMVRGILMDMIADAAAREDGIDVQGEVILINPDQLLTRGGLVGRTNLSAVQYGEGFVLIEAGMP
jgi:hypothetical protein